MTKTLAPRPSSPFPPWSRAIESGPSPRPCIERQCQNQKIQPKSPPSTSGLCHSKMSSECFLRFGGQGSDYFQSFTPQSAFFRLFENCQGEKMLQRLRLGVSTAALMLCGETKTKWRNYRGTNLAPEQMSYQLMPRLQLGERNKKPPGKSPSHGFVQFLRLGFTKIRLL